MDNTDFIQAKVTKTAPFVGADYNVGAITGDYTVFLRVTNLVGRARFSFPDTADNWTGTHVGPTFNIAGDIGQVPANPNPITKSFNRRDWPSLRLGTVAAEIRCNLDDLTGTNATVTYECYITWQS